MIDLFVLIYLDFFKEFVVYTNASFFAIGGVFLQIGADGKEHPIAYCSRILNVYERNHAVTKRDYLAVIHLYNSFVFTCIALSLR